METLSLPARINNLAYDLYIILKVSTNTNSNKYSKKKIVIFD